MPNLDGKLPYLTTPGIWRREHYGLSFENRKLTLMYSLMLSAHPPCTYLRWPRASVPLYGLTEQEFAHMLTTFPLVPQETKGCRAGGIPGNVTPLPFATHRWINPPANMTRNMTAIHAPAIRAAAVPHHPPC